MNAHWSNDEILASPALTALLAISVSLGAAGCASGLFSDSWGYDSQGCVENALRRHPHASTSRASVGLFRERCFADDGGACSALGVAFEAGSTGKADPRSAVAAYGRACQLENARGCANLGALLLSGKLGSTDDHRAKQLLDAACNAGDPAGCANLGRVFRDGRGVTADSTRASDLLDRACTAGESTACFDLAALIESTAPAKALDLYVRSCVAGERDACDRVARPPRLPSGLGGAPMVAAR